MNSVMTELKRLSQRYQEMRENEPGATTLGRGLDKLWVYGYAPLARAARAGRTFDLGGVQHPYFIHQYNATWRNERAVEIALATDFMGRLAGKRILELGNVSAYYKDHSHTVVDKYERRTGVLNFDFVDYAPTTRFEGFLSISTFEHIGWDEKPREPAKLQKAFHRLAQLDLVDRAQCLVTVPTGYNSFLDELIERGELPFARVHFMKRINRRNDWTECSKKDALSVPYDSVFPAANGLLIGRGLRG